MELSDSQLFLGTSLGGLIQYHLTEDKSDPARMAFKAAKVHRVQMPSVFTLFLTLNCH